MGGTWQLISGALESNETAWQGALREMWEETNLAPLEFYRLSTLSSFYRADNDSLNIAPMFCAIVRDDAVVKINSENSEFEWVNIDNVHSRLMWPGDHHALADVRSVILQDGMAKRHMRVMLQHFGALDGLDACHQRFICSQK